MTPTVGVVMKKVAEEGIQVPWNPSSKAYQIIPSSQVAPSKTALDKSRIAPSRNKFWVNPKDKASR